MSQAETGQDPSATDDLCKVVAVILGEDGKLSPDVSGGGHDGRSQVIGLCSGRVGGIRVRRVGVS